MASFQKRGKSWQYNISRMVNGKPDPIRKSGFATKKEAQAAAAEIEAQMRKGITPNLKPVVFSDYFKEWVDLYRVNVGKNTRASYDDVLNVLTQGFPGVYIQDIEKKRYQLFLNKFGEKHAKATVRKVHSFARACVREAIDEGIIFTDFTRGAIISGAVAAKRPEEKHLNFFDSKRLLKALETPKSDSDYLILLGLASGMRFAEMVGLTRSDFDFKANTITVNKTWGYMKKMHEGFGETKNKQSVRTLKMDKKTMGYFNTWLESKPVNLYNLVFFNHQSKYKVLSNRTANLALQTKLKSLNIEPISVHGLRHTHASILLYKGISIYYVSERLGHGDIDTTMKHYAHIVKELRKKDEQSTLRTMESMMA